MSRSCNNCGAEVLTETRYCDNCGMPVTIEAASSQEETPTRQAPLPSARRSGFDQSPSKEASLQETPEKQVSVSSSLTTPPPVGQPPNSGPPPSRRAAREEDKRHGGWFRVPILLLALLLLVLLGGGAYALTRGIGQDEVASEAQGMGTGQGVAVPDLVGASSVSEAQSMAGEDLQVLEGDGMESQEPIGTVLSQDPAAGKIAKEGSTVSVNVSKGANLPDVRGETRDEAVRILEGASFEVKEETEESSAENKGYVTEQDPQGGERETADAGTTITITVGSGPPRQAPEKAKSPTPKQTPVPKVANEKVEKPEQETPPPTEPTPTEPEPTPIEPAPPPPIEPPPPPPIEPPPPPPIEPPPPPEV